MFRESAWTIPRPLLIGVALVWQIRTVVRATWIRRARGIRGVLIAMVQTVTYPLLTIAYLTVFGGGMCVALSAYGWFRRIDDVLDGDVPPPQGETVTSYLAAKRFILRIATSTPARTILPEHEDVLLATIIREADRLKVDVREEMATLLDLMRAEFLRRRQGALASRRTLEMHASRQDACILSFCIKVFRGDERLFGMALLPLSGFFTRTDWLSDIVHDIRRGAVNIPKEALIRFRIDAADLRAAKNWNELITVKGFVPWYCAEAEELMRRWVIVRAVLGRNFGGFFKSRPLTFVFKRVLISQFARPLSRSCARIRPAA